MRRAGLDIDNNYCHNSFGKGTKPWCYFKSNDRLAQKWGYCDIPTCEQFCGNSGSTISSTAYMTSTVSSKPTVQGLKLEDPFVTCWNKCYQTGPLNGPKCMDNCIRVSSQTFSFQFSVIFRLFQIQKRENQVKHRISEVRQQNQLLSPALLVCYPRRGECLTAS